MEAPTRAPTPPPLSAVLLAERYAVARLEPTAPLPVWLQGSLTASVRTAQELSVVCREDAVPEGVRAERGFLALAVDGPLDFALVGLLARLTGALAEAQVPVFALSSYDTDLLLFPERKRKAALAAMARAAVTVREA